MIFACLGPAMEAIIEVSVPVQKTLGYMVVV